MKPDPVVWRPYAGVPSVKALTNVGYIHDPKWRYNFPDGEDKKFARVRILKVLCSRLEAAL